MGSEQFTGKYTESGRIGSWLVDRFFGAIEQLLRPGLPEIESVLEIGCGAGFSTQRMAAWLDGQTLVASDLGRPLLRLAQHRVPDVPLLQQSVYGLAHPDKSFDLVIMLEVLEHLDDPSAALKELARVAGKQVLISTPREPLWRMLNMTRLKYLGQFGNTPGHVQHWSAAGLVRQVRPWFEVEAMATPVPWTILLLRPR